VDTWYEVIAVPPSSGAVNDSTADESPGSTLSPAGASGTAAGVTATAALAGPAPTPLRARTRKAYVRPLLSPVTVPSPARAVQVAPSSVDTS
jgi:hypothetical protein